MKPIWKFRLLALTIVLVVGTVSIANFVAELVRPARLHMSAMGQSPPNPNVVRAAALAAKIAPFRGDLRANEAAMRAADVLASKGPSDLPANEVAQTAVRAALRIGPHDARMWLTLALLRAHGNLGEASILEPLKMSYLTGPNQAELIAPRLDLVSGINSISDPDLQELATSDVRAVLTRFAELRPLLVAAYARGSAAGKKLLDDSVKTADPKFIDTLHGAR
jgi:hypothetical protein